MRFDHVKILARDVTLLAEFYEQALGCERLMPVVDLSDESVSRGLGWPGATVRIISLRLPGHGDEGPELEIYRIDGAKSGVDWAYRPGQGQLSFQVDDVEAATEKVIAAGGSGLGEIVDWDTPSGNQATFVFLRDPEQNIVDLWSRSG